MPLIYNSGTISDITEINVLKTIVKPIMSHSLWTWQKIYNFIPYLAHIQTYSFGQTMSTNT